MTRFSRAQPSTDTAALRQRTAPTVPPRARGLAIDYRVYHAINQFVDRHSWLGSGLVVLETWAVPLLAVATFALWLFARPGADPLPKAL